jgi:hypothetical protein
MLERLFGSLLAVVVVSACSASLDTSLDNKLCRLTHRCLPGYECSDAGFCERARDAGTLPDSGQDTDGDDSGTVPPVVDAGSEVPAIQDAEPPVPTGPQSAPDAGSTTHPRRESPQTVPTQAEPPANPPAQDPPSVNPPAPRKPKPPPPRKDPEKGRPAGGPPPPPHAPDPMGECGAGRTRCGSTCVDLERESMSCGACDHACSAGEICSAGQCVVPNPAAGPE